MTKYSTDQLMSAWDPVETAPAQRRIGALLAVIEGAASAETLGERNRRLLRLHRALVDAPLEAHIKCASCGVDHNVETCNCDTAVPDPRWAALRSLDL